MDFQVHSYHIYLLYWFRNKKQSQTQLQSSKYNESSSFASTEEGKNALSSAFIRKKSENRKNSQ